MAPKKIPNFGALADEWITGRIEESRKPGEGYRPSTLSQWQTHISHMRTGFDLVKASDIDARAIERAIAKWRLPKKDGGRGLSQRTAAKVRTTMSRIFRYGISSKRGIVADPTKLIEKAKESSGEQSETGQQLYTGLHEVRETEVLTPEEAKRAILAATPGRIRTVLQTAIFTGTRVSELLALRWEDVDLNNAVISIRRSMSIAKVKGEAPQEKVRWFDPKTKMASETSLPRRNS